ncbi:MAG: hypothetical protein CMJ52_09570 [Planctomycetaceae bacterium]|nr:hypothetical protein [Planctomycetaceae bacterium]
MPLLTQPLLLLSTWMIQMELSLQETRTVTVLSSFQNSKLMLKMLVMLEWLRFLQLVRPKRTRPLVELTQLQENTAPWTKMDIHPLGFKL